MMLKDFMKKWGLLVVCGLLLCGSGITASFIQSNRDDQLMTQLAKISELSNKKETLMAAYDAASDEETKVASGLDASRVAKDDASAKKLIEAVCTWDSKESYDAMRKDVISKYKLADDSSFVKVFIPEVKNVNVGDKSINEIDANGLNMEFVSMDSNVTNISGDKYTYLTTVTIQSSDSAGANAEGVSAFIYTVDADGNLSELSAYNIGAND